MSITREQIKALQALEREATKAPWSCLESNNSNLVHVETALEAEEAGVQICTANAGKKPIRVANALFISEARNALPALITTWLSMADRIERVEKVLESLKTQASYVPTNEYQDGVVDSLKVAVRAVRAALALNANTEEQG